MTSYREFLSAKAPRSIASGMDAGPMNPAMFDYQQDATAFCLRQGRAALFLDTGLGKTICELEFATLQSQEDGAATLFDAVAA